MYTEPEKFRYAALSLFKAVDCLFPFATNNEYLTGQTADNILQQQQLTESH